MLREPVNEKISGIIYKTINGQPLDPGERKSIKKWMKSSKYYRALLDDIHTDVQLKNQLLHSYQANANEFWKTLLTYRASLHDGMTRSRNYWERMFLFWR